MEFRFRVCDLTVSFQTDEHDVFDVLRSVFGALPVDQTGTAPVLHYLICRGQGPSFAVTRDGTSLTAATLSDLLFLLDKDITLASQRLRADLLFVHAGVVGDTDAAWAIAAPSGTGKSTTVWALVSAGLRFLSDELAPLELSTRGVRVHPYPRALNLKQDPGAPYALPPTTLCFDERAYISVAQMPRGGGAGVLPLRGIVFLRRDTQRTVTVRPLTPGEAATHLYANALNPLAHAGMGLDVAIAVAERVVCVELALGSISESAAAILAHIDAVGHIRSRDQ